MPTTSRRLAVGMCLERSDIWASVWAVTLKGLISGANKNKGIHSDLIHLLLQLLNEDRRSSLYA